MMFYIYLHIQSDTSKPFYVGKGKGDRAYSTNRSKLWKNVASKHGWKAVIICDDLTEEEAFEVEKFYIKEYGRRNLGTGNLVNLTDGGEGLSGHIVSEETRNKISEANKGKMKPPCSEEQRTKISEACKGRVSPWKGKNVLKKLERRCLRQRKENLDLKNIVKKYLKS